MWRARAAPVARARRPTSLSGCHTRRSMPRWSRSPSSPRISMARSCSSATRSQNVTGQYTDLQAKRDAAVQERNQLELVLTHAQTIPDILSVNDRIESVQSEIDQLTGQIKVLNDQASYSSLDVSISEKAPPRRSRRPRRSPAPASRSRGTRPEPASRTASSGSLLVAARASWRSWPSSRCCSCCATSTRSSGADSCSN